MFESMTSSMNTETQTASNDGGDEPGQSTSTGISSFKRNTYTLVQRKA